ncbi:MAG: hypothetical protein K2K97_06665 [Muribaculaceae bacterium]|nr:hypothetical protein [Muribaculaceae bacterium]
MKKNYFFSAALLLGAAAIVAPTANAEGWRNMNHLLPNVARSHGWRGVITGGDGGRGVGEIFAGAGMVYQVVRDLPAGEYTLTANAFYRDGGAPECAARHFEGKENVTGYLFINDTEVPVKSLFDKDGITAATILPATGYVWGLVPNGCGEAADDFEAGHYLNTVKANHPGGDMVIGYKCYGAPNTLVAGKQVTEDECNAWSMFGNFKLTNAAGDAIALGGDGKFDMAGDADWHIESAQGQNKGRGLQNGGVFSKTNASVYDHSLTVADLPAGKYRYSIQSFNQHFLGAHPGYFIPMKSAFFVHEGKSAYDLYKEGATEYPRGAVSGDQLPSGTVNVDKLHAYIYAYTGEKINMKDYWDGEAEINDWFLGYDDEGQHVDGAKDLCEFAVENKIKNLFDEDHDEYLEVQNYKMADGNWKYVNGAGEPMWFESGHMREVAAAFVADPNLYKNTIEFELTKPTTVTIGYHKDVNQNNYAHPVFDFKLEYFDPAYTGYDVTGGGAGVADVMVDENAPVEYFNLQGVRVANPANGLYIVRQGNKVTKQIIK